MSDEMKHVYLRQARATEADLSAAAILGGMIQDVVEGNFPRSIDGEFHEDDPEDFEQTNKAHLVEFHNRLTIMMRRNPGMLGRVIGGMAVLCDPANELIDPEKDYLAPNPSSFTPLLAMHELLAFAEEFTHDNLGGLMCICHESPSLCLSAKAEGLIKKWKPAKESEVAA